MDSFFPFSQKLSEPLTYKTTVKVLVSNKVALSGKELELVRLIDYAQEVLRIINLGDRFF